MVVVIRRRQRSGRTIGYIRSFPLCRNFSFDILKCVSPIRMEIWMAKSPALREKMNTKDERETRKKHTCSPKILSSVFLTL